MNYSARLRLLRQLLPAATLAALFFCHTSIATARSHGVPNFNLVDLQGRNHELRRADGKIVVLFFTGNGCPIARQSVAKLKALQDWLGHDVTFWLINTYADDSIEDCRKEYREFMMFPLTYLRDPKQGVASVLGVERTAEVVAINTEDWSIIYQGAIDDQLTEGAQRPSAEHKFLLTALSEFKTSKPISNARTKAHGCRISFNTTAGANAEVTYAAQVAPVLRKHCAECHRDGGIGPWPMDSYAHVKDKARMIEEVLLTGQMPPWHADPAYGHWSNDRSLSTQETQTLLQWVAAGAPRGDGSDPLAEPLPPLAEWPLGKPDFTVKLPVPEEIPANGVLDYRHITLRLPATNEVWLAGLEVKPGNLRVVHHVIVRAKSKGGADDGSGQGVMLAGWAPGTLNTRFPAGTGKTIPAKARIDLELHYTTIGTPQTDQTEVAFYLLDHKPERELTTRPAPQLDLNIPPGVDESREAAIYGFAKPATLYTLMPHMHLRGKCMRFELLLPNGERELLLNVPRYDFNWQTIYRFAEPRHVPAGAWLFVTGSFDNSSNNPSNPDPKKRIHFGLQSWDEMFIGFIDAADEPSAAGPNTLVGQTPSPGAKANTALLH